MDLLRRREQGNRTMRGASRLADVDKWAPRAARGVLCHFHRRNPVEKAHPILSGMAFSGVVVSGGMVVLGMVVPGMVVPGMMFRWFQGTL